MNDYIDNLKSKLVSAIDLDQKKILRINDFNESLNVLESFPMTLDILNSSRIGKIVNDIRHFNETASDVKSRLKDLIKRWNDKLLPQHNKKQQRSIKVTKNGYNKSLKVSESVNNLSIGNRNIYGELSKSYHSSNNIEIMNGHLNKCNLDSNHSFETPLKRIKYDCELSRSKTFSESSKSQQKENHFDNKTIPNSIAQTNSLSSVDKTRKRKYEHNSNGVIITPIQKVKSTVELLADMGDLVGNDTKKKILCNEIALEDDIPRSCIPESVRPRIKPLKTCKPAQPIKLATKSVKSSPKVPNFNPEKIFSHYSPKIESMDVKVNESQKHCKSSPYLNHINSPLSIGLKSHKSTPIVNVEDGEKVSLKLKIAVKHKSKHIEPPVTNRMDDLPTLVPLEDDMTFNFDEYVTEDNRGITDIDDEIVDRLAHQCWDGYNVSRHPTTGDFVSFLDMYIVKGLYVLPWTDLVFKSRLFFPDDTLNELTRLSDSVVDEGS